MKLKIRYGNQSGNVSELSGDKSLWYFDQIYTLPSETIRHCWRTTGYWRLISQARV